MARTVVTPGRGLKRSADHSVAQQIYRDLKHRIIHGDLPPETQMSEASLAVEFRVSRTPVREALKMLSNDGYVVIAPQVGSIVSGIDIQDVLDATDVRTMLEPAAVERAMARAGGELAQLLAEPLGRMETACQRREYQSFVEGDNEFHRRIWKATGNRRLADILELVLNVVERARWQGLVAVSELPTLIELHTALYREICRGDVVGAREQMAAHMRYVRDRMVLISAPDAPRVPPEDGHIGTGG